MRQKFCRGKGLFTSKIQNLIINLSIQSLWHKPGANTLDFMRTCCSFRKYRGI